MPKCCRIIKLIVKSPRAEPQDPNLWRPFSDYALGKSSLYFLRRPLPHSQVLALPHQVMMASNEPEHSYLSWCWTATNRLQYYQNTNQKGYLSAMSFYLSININSILFINSISGPSYQDYSSSAVSTRRAVRVLQQIEHQFTATFRFSVLKI